MPNLWMTILIFPKKNENYHPKAYHKQRTQRLDSAVALAPAPIGPKAMKPQTCTVAFSGATGLNFVAGRGRGRMGEAYPRSQNNFAGKIPWIHFWDGETINRRCQYCSLSIIVMFFAALVRFQSLFGQLKQLIWGIMSSSPVTLKKASDGSIQVALAVGWVNFQEKRWGKKGANHLVISWKLNVFEVGSWISLDVAVDETFGRGYKAFGLDSWDLDSQSIT